MKLTTASASAHPAGANSDDHTHSILKSVSIAPARSVRYTSRCSNSSAVTRRSCLAGKSRHFMGCRTNDQAIRLTRDRDIGLMCTVITPAVGIAEHGPAALKLPPRPDLTRPGGVSHSG